MGPTGRWEVENFHFLYAGVTAGWFNLTTKPYIIRSQRGAAIMG